MLRPVRSFPVALCTPRRYAASAKWFSNANDANSFMGALKGVLLCLCGIACINLWFRGSVLGKVNTENDVYIPVAALRTKVHEPRTDGFVDGLDAVERGDNTQRRH
ncbi:uncharacterized protein Tco025E_04372 [Trypanosoma conorhini]|uniref:Uncharacterized protein n=1 Tax=Trypanosoma conorhini TaxID=83891 RepID=A0A422PLS4_9TRYP|nr:uncharacterized protein Tco025E_04372 [Trypanosoma conorhini]RNF18676.1 hypothetical protein Tco025E_04372 [Trypanosoma conorhini]